ncbi:MAG: hypothetical protein MJZ37_08830 [Bacilli bacterium]|nr:hypothetical protein [Bacilli bacterium]
MRKMISNNVICVKDGRVGTMVTVSEPGKINLVENFEINRAGVWFTGITKATMGTGFQNDTGAPYEDLFTPGNFQTVEFNGTYLTGVRFVDGGIANLYTYLGLVPVPSYVTVEGNIQAGETAEGITYQPGSTGKVFKAFKLED